MALSASMRTRSIPFAVAVAVAVAGGVSSGSLMTVVGVDRSGATTCEARTLKRSVRAVNDSGRAGQFVSAGCELMMVSWVSRANARAGC
jgi:hypothetical protein